MSPNGTKVFVTGSSYLRRSSFDYATVAYDASTGAELWVKRYNGPGNGQDQALALGVSPDGTRVFVTGWSRGSSSSLDYATIAYDASTGARLWVAKYNGPANGGDEARSLGVSPDGSKVFVTGGSYGLTSNYDFATVAYDASTGAARWVKRYNGPRNGYDQGTSLGSSPDGAKVFVTGETAGSNGDPDYATVAYDASTGAELWVKRYNGPGNNVDFATSLRVNPDGDTVFVLGTSAGLETQWDYATIAYDSSTGGMRWVKRYNGPANNGDSASSLGVSPDGATVFVTGDSQTSTYYFDYATVAYDAAAGATLWVARYHGPVNRDNYARSLAVSPDGKGLFVTGGSAGSRGKCIRGLCFDYATVAYDAVSGRRLWIQRYNDPANGSDWACCVMVSPDSSKVFVTGSTQGEYTTIAYSTT